MKDVLEIKSPYQGLNGKQQSATEKAADILHSSFE